MPRTGFDGVTVGILPGWSAYEDSTPDRYLREVIRGIQSTAAARGCHLLLAWGAGRVIETSGVHPAWPVVAPDSDFVPVGPWNTDGLIVMAPLLSGARSAYIQQVRAEAHPVLFISAGEEGPAVVVDNAGGIHQAITHLVEHGHRRIAFIAGDPADRGDSHSRYQAYLAAVQEFNLEADPRLVSYGSHNLQGGYSAMWEILRSKAGFTAVQASDDISAIGAMRALREAGLQIPRDVAMIGFDDQPDAVAQIPPLTSVYTPLVEIGSQAMERMMDAIEGKTDLQTIMVPTRLTTRRSCGCLPDTMTFASASRSMPVEASTRPPGEDSPTLPELEEAWVEHMLSALPDRVCSQQSKPRLHSLVMDLVRALVESIQRGDTKGFDGAVLDLLQEVELEDLDPQPFQDAVSALRGDLYRPAVGRAGLQDLRLAEDCLNRARAAISESARRVDHRHRQSADEEAFKLNILTARLSALLDHHQMIAILEECLPEIGIHHAKVMLFEPESGDPVGSSRLIGSDPEAGASFLSQRVISLPRGCTRPAKGWTWRWSRWSSKTSPWDTWLSTPAIYRPRRPSPASWQPTSKLPVCIRKSSSFP